MIDLPTTRRNLRQRLAVYRTDSLDRALGGEVQ